MDREAMIQELQDIFSIVSIPEHAMLFNEIMTELRKTGGVGETNVRQEIQRLISEGKWKRQRSGNKMYYWKID